MKKLLLIATTFASAFIVGSPEAAAADQQQTAVTACSVTAGGSLLALNSYVGLSTGTGTASLHCPVDVNLASFDTIQVSYRDSDGTGNTAHVEVLMVAVDKTSAVFGTAYVIFQSSDYATTLWNNKTQVLASTFNLDHANYYYYLKINLSRTNTSAFAPIGHVKLLTTP
ncbi:hypothetical protein [Nannocystis punicea]|uniref:Spore coat protein U domain-containing protein n=1 Tax=Nannocystis punicea TaxID=2995304 RepID=A0ABY7H6T7_9BACT|nr:hypothetical protein [Nannocystis poenicansa]WAS94988.1 hypothetical protein O0S08_02400 [Nannocystis poenicansa]